MNWSYRIGKYKKDGKTYYGLFEYIKLEKEGDGWTEEPVALEYSRSPEEIIQELEYMLKDAKHYKVFDYDV